MVLYCIKHVSFLYLARDDIISQLLTLVDLGVSAFDFGDIYTGVETLFGSLLTAHHCRGGKRQDLTLHSKVVPDLDVIRKGGVDDSYIRGIVQRSLNRLKTNYIDLVQFHWWDTGYHGYIQAALSLKKLQDEGLLRHIALTNFDAHCTSELIEAGIPIASTQVYSIIIEAGIPIASTQVYMYWVLHTLY